MVPWLSAVHPCMRLVRNDLQGFATCVGHLNYQENAYRMVRKRMRIRVITVIDRTEEYSFHVSVVVVTERSENRA